MDDDFDDSWTAEVNAKWPAYEGKCLDGTCYCTPWGGHIIIIIIIKQFNDIWVLMTHGLISGVINPLTAKITK